jgi:hypothetical protein
MEKHCCICNKKIKFKKDYCTKCNHYINVGYLEKAILRKINEEKEIKEASTKFKNIVSTNNPTYRKFWEERGFDEKRIERELKIRSKRSLEYWLDRGYSEEEAKENHINYNKRNSPEQILYWLDRGYSEKEATQKQKESIEKRIISSKNAYSHINNILRREYWLDRGYSEEEAIENIKKEQKRRFKHLSKKDYTDISKTRYENIKKDKNRYNNWIEKSKVAGKKNIYNSPIFIEYWLKKGFSIEESKKKVFDAKFISREGNSLSSKIEIKCLNDLEEFLSIKIEKGKFRYINGQYFCYDGKYGKNIIEFNGTFTHLDERFYNEKDINPYGKTFDEIKKKDSIKKEKTLTKYNYIIIWEYDYINNKETIFNSLKKFINENNKKGKIWDSRSV